MTEVVSRRCAWTVSFRIGHPFKGVRLCAESLLVLLVFSLGYSLDVPAMPGRFNNCEPLLSDKCGVDPVERLGFLGRQQSLKFVLQVDKTLDDPPAGKEGILRVKGQPVSILAVFVAPAVALLVTLMSATFFRLEKLPGFVTFLLLGFLGSVIAAIVTAILSQFEDYSPAIQQLCLAGGFIAGALASFRRFWSSGSLTENRPKGGRAL
jgi:hypothetical protein